MKCDECCLEEQCSTLSYETQLIFCPWVDAVIPAVETDQ